LQAGNSGSNLSEPLIKLITQPTTKNPANPLILQILIQTIAGYSGSNLSEPLIKLITPTYDKKSCKSFNQKKQLLMFSCIKG
jgi:hypothetical protein